MRSPWEDVPLLRRCVEHVAATRSRLLREREIANVPAETALRQGLLLGHDIASCTRDQLPHAISPIFDLDDQIGWDTWLDCLHLESADKTREDHRVLLAWIPQDIIADVDAAAMTSCTDCLVWIRPESLGL
jgi:hypothetical protein